MLLKDKIADAALEYAKQELGEEQYLENKDAVQAITQTFYDGAVWAIDQMNIVQN